MSARPVDLKDLQAAVDAVAKYPSQLAASAALGLSRGSLEHRIREAKRRGVQITKGALDVHDPVILRRQNSRLESDLAAVMKRLNEQDDSLLVIKKLIHECRRPPNAPKWLVGATTGKNTGVPTLLASDWHGDEVVKADQINGVNAFNRAIWTARTKRMFSKTIDLLIHHMHKPNNDYFVLDLGGDMLSGNIHEELRETNEAPVSQSMLHLVDLLIAGIDLLLTHFPKIVVNAVPGNHGRWDKKPRAKNRV
jgi:hypothetical protein